MGEEGVDGKGEYEEIFVQVFFLCYLHCINLDFHERKSQAGLLINSYFIFRCTNVASAMHNTGRFIPYC